MRPWGALDPKMDPRWPKMHPRWAKMAQDGPRIPPCPFLRVSLRGVDQWHGSKMASSWPRMAPRVGPGSLQMLMTENGPPQADAKETPRKG